MRGLHHIDCLRIPLYRQQNPHTLPLYIPFTRFKIRLLHYFSLQSEIIRLNSRLLLLQL